MVSSKRSALAITVVIVLSIAAIWLAYKYKTSAQEDVYRASLMASSSPLTLIGNSISELDSDNDGLKDWEESLWGTDAHKADSDGDGVSDGLEISQGKNPVVKGPNDSIQSYPMGSTGAPDEKLTNTDNFSRELFGRYATIKSQNGTISPEDQQRLIDTVIKEAEATIQRPVEYKLSSLRIVYNPTPSDIRTYATNLSDALLAPRDIGVGEELSMLGQALATRDEQVLKGFGAISTFYEKTATKLRSIAVPEPLSTFHLILINNYLRAAKNVIAFKYVFTDPIVTSANLSDYVQNTQAFSTAIDSINQYVSTH